MVPRRALRRTRAAARDGWTPSARRPARGLRTTTRPMVTRPAAAAIALAARADRTHDRQSAETVTLAAPPLGTTTSAGTPSVASRRGSAVVETHRRAHRVGGSTPPRTGVWLTGAARRAQTAVTVSETSPVVA